MKNIFFKLFILVIFFTLFPYSKTKKLYDNDELLVIFVKDPPNFEQYCKTEGDNDQYFLNLYEDNVGKVFWLRDNWHCDKIEDKFEEYEWTECHKYRKYLGIVYEYLFHVYFRFPAVKPMFYNGKDFSFCKLTLTIDLLITVANFYFVSTESEKSGYKLENLFMISPELKLFNEEELNYEEPKETFQEIVVQMGLQLKWDNEIREINLKLFRQKIDKILEGMWKRHKIRQSETAQTTHYYYSNSQQNDGDSLGLMYLMRQNWHCAEIVEKNEDEQKQKEECEKFGKYLDIFYEYLFKIYAKTEMPALSRQFPTFGPEFNQTTFIYVVFVLHKISKIFFDIERTEENDRNRSNNKEYLELDLLNENHFRNYKANFGNLTVTLRQKFDDKLKTMLKSAREVEKISKTNVDALVELRKSPFYDTVSKTENKAFIAFVKDQQNFEQFCLENEDELMESHKALPIDATLEQKKVYLTQKYQAHLGLVYLMRQNWNCAKIGKELEQHEQEECQKYRKYLDNFYEYLFNLQNEDDDPLKAINSLLLIRKVELFGTLIDVVKGFSNISKEYFQSKPSGSDKFESLFKKQLTISKEKLEKIFNSEKEDEAITEGRLKKQFDEKMKELSKKVEKMVQKEEKTMKKGEQRSAEFDDKFGTLFDSPFYGTIAQCCKSE